LSFKRALHFFACSQQTHRYRKVLIFVQDGGRRAIQLVLEQLQHEFVGRLPRVAMPRRPGGRLAGRRGPNSEGPPIGVIRLLALLPQDVHSDAVEHPRYR